MQKLELQWREFNVDLEAVDAKLKADHPSSYKGNQAANCLELWFDDSINLSAPVITQVPVLDESDEPVLDENNEPLMQDEAGPSVAEQIQAYWAALDQASAEVLSYRSQSQIKAAMEALKSDIASKTWNQLSAPQRKLIIGQAVTKADLIAAELL